jgi:acyl-[acyl carrier protein]--UDP-N-acetylglucosamine O-acyltransferase
VIGLRRAGMTPDDRRTLQDAFRLLYRSGMAPARAVERIRDELPLTAPVRALLDFIAGATRHGIVGPFRGDAAAEPEEVTG